LPVNELASQLIGVEIVGDVVYGPRRELNA